MDIDATGQLLDELIPPPGPRWRRMAVWAVFIILVAVVVATWQAGAIVPRLDEAQWLSFGGKGPVQAGVVVRNGSPRAIEITRGPDARPGLEPMGYALGTYEFDSQTGMNRLETGIDLDAPDFAAAALHADPFPLPLAPGEGVVITVVYDVTDCAAIRVIDPSDTAIEYWVRMADGPLAWLEHQRRIPMVFSVDSWPAEIAQYACGFPDPTE